MVSIWPACIFLALYALTITFNIWHHGERRRDTYDGWKAVVGSGIGIGLLYWGGFFKSIGF